MKYRAYLVLMSLCTLALVACSQSPAEVSESEWKCDKQNNERICSISFEAENHSHLPADCVIRIRAHSRRSVMGSDAIQNIVVGDKVIHVTLKPGEKRSFNETLKTYSGVTNIVVTIVGKET